MTGKLVQHIKSRIASLRSSTDVAFLIFLLLILQVSLGIKLLGMLFIYFWRRDLKFGIREKRLPLFYLLMAGVALVGYLLNYYRGFNYLILASLSILYWTVSFLIIHQIKLAIEKEGVERVENALKYFFIFNAVVTGLNLLKIMVEINAINPYEYVGLNYKYFASTGDFLRGITRDLSTVNNIINSLGLIYFLYRRKYWYSFICFLVAAFTTSNVGNFILLFAFLYVILFERRLLHKSIVMVYLSFLVVFVVKISPSNLNYLNQKIQKMLHLEKPVLERHWHDETEKEKLISNYLKNKSKVVEPQMKPRKVVQKIIAMKREELKEVNKTLDSIAIEEENEGRNYFYDYYVRLYGDTVGTLDQSYYDKYPGKYLSFKETFSFLNEGPRQLLVGAGPGNFSSKLAFKASNLGISGKYIEKFTYIAPEFKDRHMKLTLRYYLKPISEHSVINFPNSVLNQLLGEYGLIGLALFLIFYLWYFLKRYRTLTFGKILLPICMLFLLTDYWFESFTILIVFEIMMFIDITLHQKKSAQ